jgi:glycosyltransferase involved in cell wall biosynthesis
LGKPSAADRAPALSVSTVIPTYNRVTLVERAVRSALAESLPGDEIIVVDDGSTDGTEAAIRAFGPPVRYLRTSHVGAGAARNAGIAAATCDLVAFLDSDDEWEPGKLAWQRAVLENYPEVLYAFSDFGSILASGEREHNRISSWRDEPRAWSEIFGAPISSAQVAGLPADAPRFDLYIGRLYDDYLRDWCVYTCTVVVRREQAGDALRFAEDVALYEDLECFARLAGRGPACYMDVETAWQHRHTGARLTDADQVTSADTAMRIINRVWGADAEYLKHHGSEFEAVIDAHRARRVRALLHEGRGKEARQELPEFFRTPWLLRAACIAPGELVRLAADARATVQRVRS